MHKSGPWLFIFSGVSALGGIACVFEWFGIKPKDLQMNPTIPHSAWLVAGFALFAVSIGLSLYSAFFKGGESARESKLNELRADLEKKLARMEQEIGETREQIPSIAVNGVPIVGPAAFAAAASSEQRLAQLRKDAIELSDDLMVFLKEIGPEPPPKYSREEIDRMSASRTKELIESEDGDYAESSAFHGLDNRIFDQSEECLYKNIRARCNRLVPWYMKVEARYVLAGFRERTETIYYRFVVEGIIDGGLLLSPHGFAVPKNIQSIATKLRELAFKVGTEPSDEKA